MTNRLSGVKADYPVSHQKLEKHALGAREALGFDISEAINPLRLFEDLHNVRLTGSSGNIPLGYGVEELGGHAEGYARYDAARHRIEVIASVETYGWLEQGHPRATFFVAHELAHCVLHTDQLVRLARMPEKQQAAFHRGRTEHRVFEDTEWQANAFASALLMPAKGIALLEERHGKLSAAMIELAFRVSSECAHYRFENFVQRRSQLLSV